MLGQKIIDYIISARLFTMTAPDHPHSGVLAVWSPAAAEQLEALVHSDRPEYVLIRPQPGERYLMWHTRDGLTMLEPYRRPEMCFEWGAHEVSRALRHDLLQPKDEADFATAPTSRRYVLQNRETVPNGAQIHHYHEEGES